MVLRRLFAGPQRLDRSFRGQIRVYSHVRCFRVSAALIVSVMSNSRRLRICINAAAFVHDLCRALLGRECLEEV